MRKLLCAMLVVLALLAVPATSALAAEPVIEQPTVTNDCETPCRLQVTGPSIRVFMAGAEKAMVTVIGPVITVGFDDPIVGFDDPIVGTPGTGE